jgi:HD-GYP domain-containing protein (c-di-GMP phosphodiesterase class II)
LDSKQQSYKVINALTAAIEAKDPYTVGHSKRVETYSELIAMQMKLSRPKKIYTIKIAALFHDIGKIGINDMC